MASKTVRWQGLLWCRLEDARLLVSNKLRLFKGNLHYVKLKAKEVLALSKQMKLVEKTTNILYVLSWHENNSISVFGFKEIQQVQGLSILNFCLNFFLEVLTVFQSLSNLALFFNDSSMCEISPLKSPLKTSKLICAKLWSIQIR